MLCLAAWGAGARRRPRGHPYAGLAWCGVSCVPRGVGLLVPTGAWGARLWWGRPSHGYPLWLYGRWGDVASCGVGCWRPKAPQGAPARRPFMVGGGLRLWVSELVPEGLEAGAAQWPWGAWGCVVLWGRGEGQSDQPCGRKGDAGAVPGAPSGASIVGRELPMPVCARKATGIAPTAPRAAKALKPRKPRCFALAQRHQSIESLLPWVTCRRMKWRILSQRVSGFFGDWAPAEVESVLLSVDDVPLAAAC